MSDNMMSMMMVHMNAAAAAAAAAAMGITSDTTVGQSSVIAPNPTSIGVHHHQSLYPNYAPHLLAAAAGEDNQFQKLLELQSAQQHLQQQQQTTGNNTNGYVNLGGLYNNNNDYHPQGDYQTKDNKNTGGVQSGGQLHRNHPDEEALDSENEEDSSQSDGDTVVAGSVGGGRGNVGGPAKIGGTGGQFQHDLAGGGAQAAKIGKKICRVCGDKALGYNFNVVSCESCKAFFRRNALKRKEFRCPFNDSCEVTVVSRRFCQKCRLRKCFDVGMKKEWIMSDEARLQKRARIEENRRKRTSTPSNQDDDPKSVEDNNLSTEQDQSSFVEDNNHQPPPEKKPFQMPPDANNHQLRQQHNQHQTISFSSPQATTPPMFGLGGAFSPPASGSTTASSSKSNSISPIAHHNRKPSHQSAAAGHSIDFQVTSGQYQSTAIIKTEKTASHNCAPAVNNAQAFPLVPGFVGASNPVASVATSSSTAAAISHDLIDSITIPKAVLISLINQCHSTSGSNLASGTPGSLDPTTGALRLKHQEKSPIVARAEKLVIADGCCSDDDMAQCICRCSCGARSASGRIGVKTVDKCVGPTIDQPDSNHNNNNLEVPRRTDRNDKPLRKSNSTQALTCAPMDEFNTNTQQQRCGPMSAGTTTSGPTDDQQAESYLRMDSTSIVERKYSRHVAQLSVFENWKLRELHNANRIMTDPLDKQEQKSWDQMEKMGQIDGGRKEEEKQEGEATEKAEDGEKKTETIGERQVQQQQQQDGDAMQATNTIRLADFCVRRIIKMCKQLGAFCALCQDDQIALLKGGCMELMLLRGVMTFIPEKESWRPVGCKETLLSLEVLKGVKGNVYEEHRRFLNSFREEWRRSDAIMLTLSAITLFNPRRPNLVHSQSVQMEQETYSELLKHYLDIMYGVDTLASSEAFRELMLRVDDVKRLNDYAATLFLEVNPTDVEPLLIEIFDMK